MKKLLIPITIIFLLLTHCKKEDNQNNAIFIEGISVPRITTATNSIAIDNQDNVWFATDSGLYKFNNVDWIRFELPISMQKINSLSIKTDTILLSTLSGALTLKIEENGISIIDEYNTNKTSIISDSVNVSGFDPYNNMWFGTYLGLSLLNGTQWASNKNINYKLTSRNDNFSCIAFRQNDFFFGTLGNNLWHIEYDNETDAVTGASLMVNDFNGRLTTDSIFSLCTGNDSSIWIGSNKGLTKNKGTTHFESGEFVYYLEGQKVHSIIESDDQSIWVGTEEGLFVKENNLWTNYTTEENLADNFILSLAEDMNGGIWIGTQNGISYFKNSTFTKY